MHIFTSEDIAKIFDQVQTVTPSTNRKIIGLFFQQPSTRTFYSFMSAAQRLGYSVLPISGTDALSIKKGETLQSTLHTLAIYCDVLVVRGEFIANICKELPIPVINAGDERWHPTQALGDYALCTERISDLRRVTLAGDFGWNRTNRSFIELVRIFHPDAIVDFPHSIQELQESVQQTDVLYVTRPQCGIGHLPVTEELLRLLPESAIVLHPLPHTEELELGCLTDPRVLVDEQMRKVHELRVKLLSYVTNELSNMR